MTLPYTPEIVPRTEQPAGVDVLAEVASISGGEQRTDVTSVYDDPPRSSQRVSLLPWLFIASVVVLVTEIGGRRLNLWARTSERFTRTARVKERPAPRPKPARSRHRPIPSPTVTPDVVATATQPESAAEVAPQPEAVDIFRQAKSRAKKRLN